MSQASIGSGERAVYVPIEPCRMLDTRAGEDVPGRKTPLGANSVIVVDASAATGNCDGFGAATGLSLNVTPVDPSADTYLSFVPGTLTPPSTGVFEDSSSINPSPSQPPTPNAVNVDLSDDSIFSIYNPYGTVEVVVDVVGYFEDHHHDDRYYTKAAVDRLIADATPAIDAYTTDQVDNLIAPKANSDDVYTRTQVDDLIAAVGAGSTFERVIVVPGGGSATENGTALQAAMTTVTEAGSSLTDPWTIWLEPGEFRVSGPISVPTGTHLRGTDRVISTLIAAPANTGGFAIPMIGTAGPAIITDLRITSSEPVTAVAPLFRPSADSHLERVSIDVQATTGGDAVDLRGNHHRLRDVSIGLSLPSGSNGAGLALANDARVALFEVEVAVEGSSVEAIYSDGGTLRMSDSDVTAADGAALFMCCGDRVSSFQIRDSVISSGVDGSVRLNSNASSFRIENSVIDGDPTAVVGTGADVTFEARYTTLLGTVSLTGTGASSTCRATVSATTFLPDTCP